jgi:NAD(P)-dependent dehydrogenase (short-subunit alcohol dehydrogenase family)
MMGVLPGMMAPIKIAEALAHLASDAASTTTGASLVVDNGTLWS